MKKAFRTVLLVVLAFLLATSSLASALPSGSSNETDPRLPALVDKSKLARLIISTDVECDDMNGMITTAFFAGDMDIVGVVRSSGEWHWDGDRDPDDYSINLGTTLEEVMVPWASTAWLTGEEGAAPPWRCRGEEPFSPIACWATGNSGPRSLTAGSLTHYREADDNWLNDLWDVQYRAVYPNLIKHNPNYPDPDYLVSITKRGNTAFEGDIRFKSPGSELIYNEILKLDDKRPLVITRMGGGNTFLRAMLDIYLDYYGTAQWDTILEHIQQVVVGSASGEDDSWNWCYVLNGEYDASYNANTPGAVRLGTVYRFATGASGASGVSSYGSPDLNAPAIFPSWTWASSGTAYDINKFYQGKWQGENIQQNHGPLAAHYYTMLDGQYIGADYDVNAEPRTYQWGRTGIHDAKGYTYGPYPGVIEEYPNAAADYEPGGWGRMYAKYDWTGHQGTGMVFGSGLGSYSEAYEWGKYGVGYGGRRGTHRGIAAMNNNGNYVTGASTGTALPFARALWEEIAGRADWCVAENFEDANHAPFIKVGENLKIEDHFVYALPGQDVKLEADVSDPDGDTVYTSWWVFPTASAYSGATYDLSPKNSASPKTSFTVPADAVAGDYFNFIIQARDNDASAPMTSFNQVVVHVVDTLPEGAEGPAPAPAAATETSAVVTVEKGDMYAKPGEAIFLNANVENSGERVYMFWKVNKEATVYSGSSRLLRTWDLYNYSTGFTVPTNAVEGDSIVVEMWGGKLGEEATKFNQINVHVVNEVPGTPVITSSTVYPKTIVQGRAASLVVTVEGENLEGKTVTATILGKTAVVENGKAVIKLTADDVFEYGYFKTQVEVEGTWIKYDLDTKGFLRAVTEPEDLWAPAVKVDGENTIITFCEENQEFAKTDVWKRYPILDVSFNAAKKKVEMGATIIDNSKVSAEGNVITIGAVADPGQAIKISGVKFADLYPSYSFSFTVRP